MLLFLLACISSLEVGQRPPIKYMEDTDSFDTTLLPGVPDDPDFPFGEVTHDLQLEIDEAALTALAADPKTDVHATLSYNGQSWDVGLHLKGSSSFRDMDGKASFKIDVHQWSSDQRFYGLKRLTLNNMIQDATMSSEHLSYALHARMGGVAPRHGYARVTVNGALYGLYGLVETVDDDFLERNFMDDDAGNLYEGGYGGDFNEGCAKLFSQSEGSDESLDDLNQVIDAVLDSTDENYTALLSTFFDLDALLDLWAVELVTSNNDAYTSLGNNFFVYHALIADQWTMIPWGPDQAFAGAEPILAPAYGALAARCQAAPDCATQLHSHIQMVLDTWESTDFTAYVEAETARIETDCRTDPRSAWGDYGCRDALIELRSWAAARPDVVRTELGGD